MGYDQYTLPYTVLAVEPVLINFFASHIFCFSFVSGYDNVANEVERNEK